MYPTILCAFCEWVWAERKIFFIPFFRVNELLQSASRFIPSNFPTDYIAISCMTVDHSALIPPQFHLWMRGGCAARIDAQGLNKRLRESLQTYLRLHIWNLCLRLKVRWCLLYKWLLFPKQLMLGVSFTLSRRDFAAATDICRRYVMKFLGECTLCGGGGVAK